MPAEIIPPFPQQPAGMVQHDPQRREAAEAVEEIQFSVGLSRQMDGLALSGCLDGSYG